MWIASDEPHPRVRTRTGVVTKAASVSFYASEFVLLASRQRNRSTNWVEKNVAASNSIASMKYRNCYGVSAELFDVFDQTPKMVVVV